MGTIGIADRLSSTLFVVALAHGVVILGVTFANGPADDTDALPSLNVTLLVDAETSEQTITDSDLLAARSQRGGGRPEDSPRPTTTLAANHPLSQLGDPLGADLNDGKPREASPEAEQLVTRNPSDRQIQAIPETTETPAELPMSAAALIRQVAPDTLAAEIDDQAQSQRSEDQDRLQNPSTSESAIAAYLVGWRQRVERIGTANFPQRFLTNRRDYGRPVLEVAISADGTLADIVVRRSSGDSALDQAALKILRLAAPFESLPDPVLAEHDVLRFAYEWDFSNGDTAIEAQ